MNETIKNQNLTTPLAEITLAFIEIKNSGWDLEIFLAIRWGRASIKQAYYIFIYNNL